MKQVPAGVNHLSLEKASFNHFIMDEDIEHRYSGPGLDRPFAAVINSHQFRFPEVRHQWIRQTMKCIDMLVGQNATLICSVGLHSHEFPLWYAGQRGMHLLMIVPIAQLDQAGSRQKQLLNDFQLDFRRTGFLFIRDRSSPGKSKIRDRLMVDLADQVFPIAIRDKGYLRSVLDHLSEDRIDRQFQVPFRHYRWTPIRPCINNNRLPFSTSWLIHWTHRFSGPFPGESTADYYRSVLNTTDGYSHCAFHCLIHILKNQVIYGSCRGIRGKHRVTALTQLAPHQVMGNMKWNPGRMRFAFEPFGIAFDQQVLESMGARPVIYANPDVYSSLPASDKSFFQNPGKSRQWTWEKEWRVIGDLSLKNVALDEMIVIVPNDNYKKKLQRQVKGVDIFCLE